MPPSSQGLRQRVGPKRDESELEQRQESPLVLFGQEKRELETDDAFLSLSQNASKHALDASSSLPPLLILLLISTRLAGARFNRIEDCDETFNYWEPTHFLQHGYGLQTWEYSPVYAIRSWTYAGLHAVVGWGFELLTLGRLSKAATFYFIRTVLALFSASSEVYLSKQVAKVYGLETGTRLLFLLATSAGMFAAAPAYLPSSFAMCTTTFAFAMSLDLPSWSRTLRCVLWFGLGSVVGWPFAAALALPFALEDLLSAANFVSKLRDMFKAGLIAILLLLLPLILFDSYFYRKLVIVPLQIILYNVFGGDLGPDLYGTEPWTFYSANLLLNFNIVYLFAVGSAVVIPLAGSVERIPMSRTMGKLGWWYLWTVIFTLQPHKEERFMFVVYPLLCFNAAICLGAFESLASRITGGRLAKWAIWGVVLGSAAVSLSRVVGLHFYYSAPMEVWARTGDVVREHANSGKLPTRNTDISVCVAKEWHRFSTHYFLPEVSNRRVRLRFLKSSFGGLLPKDWVEDVSGEPWRRGSFTIPKGMNNENREELDRYVDPLSCDYLVDLRLPLAPQDHRDPDHGADTTHWEKALCLPFLDKDRTSSLARILWIPGLKRAWGEYCLLARRR